MEDRKGFVAAMFDFSFSELITTRIVAVVYGVLIFFSFLAAISVAGTVNTMSNFLFALIAFPIVFLFGVAVSRIYMEIVMVMFKIAEHTRDTARNTAPAARQGTATPAGY